MRATLRRADNKNPPRASRGGTPSKGMCYDFGDEKPFLPARMIVEMRMSGVPAESDTNNRRWSAINRAVNNDRWRRQNSRSNNHGWRWRHYDWRWLNHNRGSLNHDGLCLHHSGSLLHNDLLLCYNGCRLGYNNGCGRLSHVNRG